MSRRRGIKGRDGEIWQQVRKELVTARKKAGQKVGSAIVKKQRSKLRSQGAGGRRQKAVRHVVGKDGTLVLLDHAPLAVAQEEGETLTAKGGLLTIGRAGQSLGKAGTRIPGAFTFRAKSGALLLMRKVGKGKNSSMELLATMLRSIRIRKSLGFEEQVASMADEYVDQVETNLIEGTK